MYPLWMPKYAGKVGSLLFFVIQTYLSPVDVTISFGGWSNQSASWTLSAFCVSFGDYHLEASSGQFTMLFLTWLICKV